LYYSAKNIFLRYSIKELFVHQRHLLLMSFANKKVRKKDRDQFTDSDFVSVAVEFQVGHKIVVKDIAISVLFLYH